MMTKLQNYEYKNQGISIKNWLQCFQTKNNNLTKKIKTVTGYRIFSPNKNYIQSVIKMKYLYYDYMSLVA